VWCYCVAVGYHTSVERKKSNPSEAFLAAKQTHMASPGIAWSRTQWDQFHRTGIEPVEKLPGPGFKVVELRTPGSDDGVGDDGWNRSAIAKKSDEKKQINNENPGQIPKLVAAWTLRFGGGGDSEGVGMTNSRKKSGTFGFFGKLLGAPAVFASALQNAHGSPKITLSRDLNLRAVTGSNNIFSAGTLRLHVFPDVKVGVSSVVVGRDDRTKITLDCEAGVDPAEPNSFTVSGGVFLELNPCCVQFGGTQLGKLHWLDPVADRVTFGADFVAAARAKTEESARRSGSGRPGDTSESLDRLGRPSGGSRRRSVGARTRYENDRDVAVKVTATRNDSVWAKVRIWRGFFLTCRSGVSFVGGNKSAGDAGISQGTGSLVSSGRDGRYFTIPSLSIEFHADPNGGGDFGKASYWDFYERGSAKEAFVLESKRYGLGRFPNPDTVLPKLVAVCPYIAIHKTLTTFLSQSQVARGRF
jgi:hypothetical protein